MTAEVFFTPSAARGKDEVLSGRIAGMLEATGFLGSLEAGDRVAVKIHPGEMGSTSYLRPAIASSIVKSLLARGVRPFVTETTTLYCRERFTAGELRRTAAHNGFTEETMGCRFVVGDAGPDVEVRATGPNLESVGVASEIARADALLVLAHFTAHLWTAGVAGAVKQLGMGCVGRRTKREVHRSTTIEIDRDLCVACGGCVEVCKSAGIEVVGDVAEINDECARCGVCIGFCDEGAITYAHDLDRFAGGLAEAAAAAASCFPREKAVYVNALVDVTWHCDCEDFSDDPVFPDIGVLVSRDPVALDQASADLVNSATPCPGTLADTPEVLAAPDRLLALSGMEWWRHLEKAPRAGLGTRSYVLTQWR
ncbi:MAG: DUF362 domain-containing protein [Actinomycetota bacterium]